MFETLGALTESAVSLLVDQIGSAGEKLAEKAAEAAGSSLLSWFKGKLTDPIDRGALERLEAEPGSEGAREMLKGALHSRLEKDETLVSELTALLHELGAGDNTVSQNMSIRGTGNVGTQVTGSGNQVNETRRK